MSFRPLNTQNSMGNNFNQVNDMVRQLNNEATTKTFNGATGKPAVTLGRLSDGKYGLELTDGKVTTRIVAGSITQNDGTNNRLFLGNE